MMRWLLAVTTTALLLAAPTSAVAEGSLASEIARTGLWANTSTNTVAVWGSGSQPCRSDVTDRTYGTVWHNVPLPCNFQPDPGSDGEAILRDQTGSGLTYEFWTMQWNWNVAGKPNGWSAGYITAGTDGVQGSGIRFEPGLPRLNEFAAGVIPHEVQIEVPQACGYFKAPAIRTDGGPASYCIPYGQRYQLPATTDCTVLATPAARMVCAAARTYGLIVTDQTHNSVVIRFEEMKTRPADGAPYYNDGGYFGCAATSGPYCWPTTQGAFRGFPWTALAPTN